jgi:hypothetical protein
MAAAEGSMAVADAGEPGGVVRALLARAHRARIKTGVARVRHEP